MFAVQLRQIREIPGLSSHSTLKRPALIFSTRLMSVLPESPGEDRILAVSGGFEGDVPCPSQK